MENIFDYIRWRGDLNLRQSSFNAVDSLILCRLSYFPLGGLVPGKGQGAILLREAYRRFAEKQGDPEWKKSHPLLQKEDPALFAAMASSERFGSMRLSNFVNSLDYTEGKQFSAVTITMDEGVASLGGNETVYVAYRGTDNTLVGWKEDFEIAFRTVPAQQEAAEYLDYVAEHFTGPIRVGGHSKGGNLAVFAASFCSTLTQNRVVEVYNNDGPGFTGDVLEKVGYQKVIGRVHTFVPQSSVIGMLLEHEEAYTVVCSDQVGLFQHDLYSWRVLGADFVRVSDVTETSKFIDSTLKSWICGMTPKQREVFVDSLFGILQATGAKTVSELTEGWFKNAGGLAKKVKNVDEPTRQVLGQVLGLLKHSAKENVPKLGPGKEG